MKNVFLQMLATKKDKFDCSTKGPFVNYVIMFLAIFDQVSNLVIIGYHFTDQP